MGDVCCWIHYAPARCWFQGGARQVKVRDGKGRDNVDGGVEEPNDAGNSVDQQRAVSFGDAALFWLKLGFISFGGPAGQIAIMHRELVERRRWVSEARFLHALNYCMLLPGPEAQQLATYVGWLLHRVKGGLIAGGLFVLPSVFILAGLSYLYAAHGDAAAVAGVLNGFRPVVVAIICEAVLRIGRRAVRSPLHLSVSLGAFLALQFAGVAFPVIVAASALIGWTASRAEVAGGNREQPVHPAEELRRPSLFRAAVITTVCLLLWLGGLALLSGVSGLGSLHVQEYGFFTRVAFVTFGGAYAVLAYVSQIAVEQFGWLTQAQIVDGLALAETTPGPLVMVLQFVGFMAAWNNPVGGMTPLVSGIVGAAATSFVTFLPCFFFIFVGAPYIELLRSHRRLDGAMRAVTAAVVGVILNLAMVFGIAVLLPVAQMGAGRSVDLFATTLAAVAFLALWKLRLGAVPVIAAGGVLGLARGLIL